ALGAALAWTVLRGRRPQLSVHAVPRAAVHLLAAAALAAPAFAYWLLHQVATPSSVAWWLAGGAAIATVAALLVALAATGDRPGAARGGLAARAFAWTAALVVGFLLSNNLTDGFAKGHLRSVLAAVLPGYDTPLASRSLLGDTPVTGLSFPTFTGQECSISGHCVSPGYFLAAYGFVLVVALAGWVALGPMSSDGAINGRRVAWLIMVGSLGLSLALVDFSGAPLGTAWVLTRFIEVPYYGLLALGAMAFAGTRNRVTTGVGLGVLALWTVIPIVVNLVPVQLVRNAHWLARAVAG
ncbi:MAG: hypothetical protein JWQ20_371, partial [Conexibacter sp.]|nr:hypothetical protein [Conexibacter sp.]